MNAKGMTPAAGSKARKLILQMVIGMLVGASVTFAALNGLERTSIDLDNPARIAGLATGLVFALIGLVVLLGLLAPKAGSHLLNVEDADELREQRGPLAYAALVMLLGGFGLIILALATVAGASGLLSPKAALIGAGLCFAGTGLLGFQSRSKNDELMRSLSAESCVLTVYWLLFIGALWGSLAHLGYADWISPLGFLAGLVIVQLITSFWVVGRRGLLKPR